MGFNIPKIEASNQDIKREIILPTELTLQLTEFIGIMIGDGHLGNYIRKGNTQSREIVISGNLTEDIDYFRYINSLFNNLFGIELKLGNQRKNELYAKIESKLIFTFLKYLKIPVGNKGLIRIPTYLLKSDSSLIFSFMRGLFDTDGSITFKSKNKHTHTYPVITLSSKSPYLIEQISKILSKNKFLNYTQYNVNRKRKNKIHKINNIYINGRKNLERWMNLIGFNNPKHLTKYQVWKKFGFCPPYTTLKQRKEILSENLSPLEFYRKL